MIRHCGILVKNIDESLRIYKDVLGFEEIERKTLKGKYIEGLLNRKGLELTYSKLKLKGCKTLLELWKIEKFIPPYSFSHISLDINNLDQICIKLKEKGVQFFSEPLLSPHKAVKVVFCQDEDGNRLELVESLRKKKDFI